MKTQLYVKKDAGFLGEGQHLKMFTGDHLEILEDSTLTSQLLLWVLGLYCI